ncbi:MAG TPA: type II secretion system protein [Stenomitos sp.]
MTTNTMTETTRILLRSQMQRQGGFSLIEAVVGMVMFLAVAAGMVPIIMVSKAFTLQSDSRIGAIAISQQVMDSLRARDIATLPSSGTVTTLPSGDSLTNLPYKGKTYSATITYCETSSYCDSSSRHLKVKVYNYGFSSTAPIYQLETVYTRLQ